MTIKLNARIPAGPLAEKWDKHRFEMKLVNPANKRKYHVIVVGSGLAGASASASLSELGYRVSCFCFQDSPRRAHSIAVARPMARAAPVIKIRIAEIYRSPSGVTGGDAIDLRGVGARAALLARDAGHGLRLEAAGHATPTRGMRGDRALEAGQYLGVL